MYVLKGFITNALFSNNTKGVVAPFGEISTLSSTYAREKGLYKSTTSPDIGLVSFISSNNAVATTVSLAVSEHVIGIAKHIYDTNTAATGQVFADEMLLELLGTFASVAESFECGEMINSGTLYIPEWVSWKNTSISTINTSSNYIKIWFADNSFQYQYDEYEIIAIPPTDTLDDFFKIGSVVETMLTSKTPSESMLRIQNAKDGYPDTIVRSESYDYVDPRNPSHKVSSTWSVLIYGANGNNIDAITEVLINYILAHSTHTRDEWILILPDLFRRTEFLIVPVWDKYAIPNRTLEAGIYSPTSNLKAALVTINKLGLTYTATHVGKYAGITAHPYKSLQMLSIGSPDNRNSWFQLTDVFADYIAVSSTSIDFNRMSQTTQNWANMLSTMLIIAETMSEFTNIPSSAASLGLTKTTRNGVLYLVARYDNINYLICAKKNILQ